MSITEHENELADLVVYFKTATFPKFPLKLNKYLSLLGDPQIFINGEVSRIQDYNGADNVRDGLFRHLRELKALCEKEAAGNQ